MKTGKHIIRTIAFLLIILLAIWIVPRRILKINDNGDYNRAMGFNSERRDSLDAVFVGASNVHSFWQPAIGWNNSGIAVYNLSFNGLPINCYKYLIAEARKTQPNALYIINLNSFKSGKVSSKIASYHRVVDYMPDSLDKVKFIHSLGEQSGFSFGKRMELLFPFIRFHSRWDSLAAWSYGVRKPKYKASNATSSFLSSKVDIADQFVVYNTVRALPQDGATQVFEDLLDYLDRENVNALFVTVPQVISMENQGYLNVLKDTLKSRGYPCLDMMRDYETLAIDPHVDFRDTGHINIRGSIKVTDYMAEYLVEKYHFKDKRGQADYADWDRESKAYDKLMDTWILPFEREHTPWRDIEAPTVEKPVVDGQNIQLTWTASEGADGYVIYRNTKNENDGRWVLLATVGADTLSYVDSNLEYATRYTYSIAPYVEEDGQRIYGNFSIKGVSARTPREEQDQIDEMMSEDGVVSADDAASADEMDSIDDADSADDADAIDNSSEGGTEA